MRVGSVSRHGIIVHNVPFLFKIIERDVFILEITLFLGYSYTKNIITQKIIL